MSPTPRSSAHTFPLGWPDIRSARRPTIYILHFVVAVFDLALADHLLADSPATGVKSQKLKKPIRKTPTFEEFHAIVADICAMRHNAEARDSGDFVEFIGLAGLGQAEATALTWGDVDFLKEQIVTFRLKTSRGFAVPLYPQLRPLLERIRQERGGRPPREDKVFRVLNAKKAIAAACKRLGLARRRRPRAPVGHRSRAAGGAGLPSLGRRWTPWRSRGGG